jgi:hypothetical protein
MTSGLPDSFLCLVFSLQLSATPDDDFHGQVPAVHKAFIFHGLLLYDGVRLGDLGIQVGTNEVRMT